MSFTIMPSGLSAPCDIPVWRQSRGVPVPPNLQSDLAFGEQLVEEGVLDRAVSPELVFGDTWLCSVSFVRLG